MTSDSRERRTHLHPSYECGICGRAFILDEECLALIGSEDSNELSETTSRFRIPKTLAPFEIEHYVVCQHSCQCGKPDAPAVMVHHDCIELFKQRVNSKAALDCLWRVAYWRKPWKAAPSLFLPEAINVGPAALTTVSLKCSIPKLAELPYEIVEEIYQHSSSAIFWRTAAAIELGNSIKTSLEHGSTLDNFSVSVKDVFAWERGGALVTHHDQSMLPLIRVMIDSRGIRKLERLADNLDHWDLERYDQYAFVLEHESKFENVEFHIKDGLAQLQFPSGGGLPIWDTPNPPKNQTHHTECMDHLEPACVSWGNLPPPTSRFKTIRLDSITGITFFFRQQGGLKGMHAHTSESAVAWPPLTSISHRGSDRTWESDQTTWAHFPLAQGDKILDIYVVPTFPDSEFCIVFETQLAGFVAIGEWTRPPEWYFLYSDPEAFVYHNSGFDGVKTFGIYSRPSPPVSMSTHTWQPPNLWPNTFIPHNTLFSAAPLMDVVQATIFHRPGTSLSSGVLFDYENGAQRAVGECRIGHDSSTVYVKPRAMCVRLERYEQGPHLLSRPAVQVEFSGEHEHCHAQPYWSCYGMSGTLRWFYNYKDSLVEVWSEGEDGDQEEQKH